MEKQNKKIISCLLIIVGLFFVNKSSKAENLAMRLKGMILLQVEQNGEAWYVNPDTEKRHYMGRPWDAFELMKELGLGVKHEFIESNFIFPDYVVGKILLDVEDKGKAYYVYPKDKKAYYLGKPQDAFNIMRNLGLGITNNDLAKISTSGFSLVAVGDLWNLYTNNDFGFSMKIPKEDYGNLDCGKIIVEEGKNSITIKREKEIMKESVLISQNCFNICGGNWEIKVGRVSNSNELNKFLEEKYCTTARVKKMVLSNQKGVYDIYLESDFDPYTEEGCYINYLTVNKYYPENNIVVAWNLGQDRIFVLQDDETADDIMINSFKFLD